MLIKNFDNDFVIIVFCVFCAMIVIFKKTIFILFVSLYKFWLKKNCDNNSIVIVFCVLVAEYREIEKDWDFFF